MRITNKRALTVAATICSAASCFGSLAPMAHAAGPGSGRGLVLLGTFPCTNLATGAVYSMTFMVPGAQNAADRGTGAMNAPFPGFLFSYTQLSGTPAPIPTGTWQLLAFPTPGRQIGLKTGLQGDAFDCGSAPTGPGL
jgi:hypothetical protein